VIDPGSIRFGEPLYLWLQALPALLLLLWCWQAFRRRRDVRNYRARRRTPDPERIPALGPLGFWFCQIAALALMLFALSQPRALASLVRSAGADVVVLQDGSASMYVRDVEPDRWQRSVAFLRVLAQSLQWKEDRIALALFAHVAAPQVRLTRDPNTFFFFLDHVERESPFPLYDDTTWDTNIELGIHWGTRLVEKDEELSGRSPNGLVFVLVSDGQVWSGELDKSLRVARDRDIPVHVVGVGTASGGFIPQAPLDAGGARPSVVRSSSPLFSTLDRQSLQTIAREGRGRYFELDRDSDRTIAATIIDSARRRAGRGALEESFNELHWYSLAAAAALVAASALLLRERVAVWLVAAGGGAALAVLWAVVR
jgi:Ca-activated chloride channel family protein